MDSIISRLLITFGLIIIGLLVYVAFSRLAIRRLQGKQIRLENIRPGVPTILYFTAPMCVSCATVQTPAIERLASAHGAAVQVVKVDAQAQPHLADQWGVLSVPATFILDQTGKPHFCNLGLTQADKLE